MPLVAPATPSALHRYEPVAAVLVGLALGAVAVLVASTGNPLAALLVVPAAAPFLALVLGNLRRTLLAVAVIDVPLLWDLELNYQRTEGDLGALGGLNLSITTLAVGALYLLWIADWLGGRELVARLRLRAAAPLLVLLTCMVVSLAVATDRSLALYQIALFGQSLLLFLYVAGNIRTRGDADFVIAGLLAALLLESVLIIALELSGISFDALGIQGESAGRAAGTLGSPNVAGGVLAALLPVAAAVLVTATRPVLRRLSLAGLVLGGLALLLTLSRGGWLAAAAGLTLLVAVGWRGGLFKARVLVAGLAVMLVAAAPLYGAAGQRLSGDDEGAAESRVPLARLAEDIIRDQPVTGVGANNFAAVIPQYAGPEFAREWLYTVHNQYLLVWAELGVVALAAFVWFLVAVVRRGLRCWKASDRQLSPLALGLTAAVVGQAAHMVVDLASSRAQVQLLLLIAGLITALDAMAMRGAPR